MNKLIENITNIHGDHGRQWIKNLPNILKHWQIIVISHISPVDNMTYNCITKAIGNHQPVVLKIGCDKQSSDNEKRR